MANFTDRLTRYLLTIRWLRISQLFWFVIRRFLPSVNPAAVPVEAARTPLAVVALAKVMQPETPVFSFIGIQQPAATPVNWHPEDQPRLWRYNLHYFDFLLWDQFSDDLKAALIDDWIEANPLGTVDAWEPYTASLRIVNWAKYFAARAEHVPEHWHASLINQANWLLSNLEYHILANHFLKNAKALVYAGALYAGDNGSRYLRRGTELFAQEVAEQVLADGGHYERSLMYHAIVLEDLLDVVNLVKAQPGLFSQDFGDRISASATGAARFLEDMLGGDGRIPLFNDAAFGIAPLPAELIGYAERVLGYQPAPKHSAPIAIDKAASGYYGYRLGNETLLIDCGQLAPDYQPGHGHCDCLSFELCLDGRRVIVDTGTLGYETDARRDYMRGTAAHNTVEVKGENQSEVWGGFRVARRARPRDARLSEFTRTHMQFSGAHDGYERLAEKVSHERSIYAEFGRSWRIADALNGRGIVAVKSYLHFAPGLELRQAAGDTWEVLDEGRVLLTVQPDAGCHTSVATTEYYPRFGVAEDKQTLVLEADGELPLKLGYLLERTTANSLT